MTRRLKQLRSVFVLLTLVVMLSSDSWAREGKGRVPVPENLPLSADRIAWYKSSGLPTTPDRLPNDHPLLSGNHQKVKQWLLKPTMVLASTRWVPIKPIDELQHRAASVFVDKGNPELRRLALALGTRMAKNASGPIHVAAARVFNGLKGRDKSLAARCMLIRGEPAAVAQVEAYLETCGDAALMEALLDDAGLWRSADLWNDGDLKLRNARSKRLIGLFHRNRSTAKRGAIAGLLHRVGHGKGQRQELDGVRRAIQKALLRELARKTRDLAYCRALMAYLQDFAPEKDDAPLWFEVALLDSDSRISSDAARLHARAIGASSALDETFWKLYSQYLPYVSNTNPLVQRNACAVFVATTQKQQIFLAEKIGTGDVNMTMTRKQYADICDQGQAPLRISWALSKTASFTTPEEKVSLDSDAWKTFELNVYSSVSQRGSGAPKKRVRPRLPKRPFAPRK